MAMSSADKRGKGKKKKPHRVVAHEAEEDLVAVDDDEDVEMKDADDHDEDDQDDNELIEKEIERVSQNACANVALDAVEMDPLQFVIQEERCRNNVQTLTELVDGRPVNNKGFTLKQQAERAKLHSRDPLYHHILQRRFLLEQWRRMRSKMVIKEQFRVSLETKEVEDDGNGFSQIAELLKRPNDALIPWWFKKGCQGRLLWTHDPSYGLERRRSVPGESRWIFVEYVDEQLVPATKKSSSKVGLDEVSVYFIQSSSSTIITMIFLYRTYLRCMRIRMKKKNRCHRYSRKLQ